MRTIQFRAFLKSNQKMYDVLTLDIIDQKALIDMELKYTRATSSKEGNTSMKLFGMKKRGGLV